MEQDGKQYYTIKEASLKAGITTQAVYKLVAKQLSSGCKVVGNTKFIDAEMFDNYCKERLQTVDNSYRKVANLEGEGLQEIDNKVAKYTEEELELKLALVKADSSRYFSETIALKSQIEFLQKEIEAKNEQIKELTASLKKTSDLASQAQSLQLVAEHKLAVIEDKQKEESKKGFFSFLKRKPKVIEETNPLNVSFSDEDDIFIVNGQHKEEE